VIIDTVGQANLGLSDRLEIEITTYGTVCYSRNADKLKPELEPPLNSKRCDQEGK
jgi:hypothetical protein